VRKAPAARTTGRAPSRRKPARTRTGRKARKARKTGKAIDAVPVTAAELRALRREIDRKMTPMRWNPDTDDVQRSVAQLVLTIVEFLRQLMERQAIRRMEQKTLSRSEVEAVGSALMKLEETIREIGAKFGLTPEDLNLDLGPLGKLM
jgi:Gas vesicle protein K